MWVCSLIMGTPFVAVNADNWFSVVQRLVVLQRPFPATRTVNSRSSHPSGPGATLPTLQVSQETSFARGTGLFSCVALDNPEAQLIHTFQVATFCHAVDILLSVLMACGKRYFADTLPAARFRRRITTYIATTVINQTWGDPSIGGTDGQNHGYRSLHQMCKKIEEPIREANRRYGFPLSRRSGLREVRKETYLMGQYLEPIVIARSLTLALLPPLDGMTKARLLSSSSFPGCDRTSGQGFASDLPRVRRVAMTGSRSQVSSGCSPDK